MSDVFISYKKEDLSRVEPIARALAQAGYNVWWDHRIPAGRTYRQVIGAALQSARCVIVVWSSLSVGAQWVLDEADEGKRRNVLLPLLIDDIEIPYGFRQIEAARLVGWRGDTKHPEWQNVLSSVAHFVGRAPGGPPKPLATPSDAGAPAEHRAPRGRGSGLGGPLLGALIGALVVGGGYYAWNSGLIRLPTAQSEIADAGKQTTEPATTTTLAENAAAAQAPTRAQRRGTATEPETHAETPAPQTQTSTAADKPAEPATPRRRTPPPVVQTPPVQTQPVQTQPASTQASGPRACRSGYVWREARATDFICVTPDSRARVRQENATASQRVNPQGAYGAATCVSGYVWREAFDGDVVCVTPDRRTEVHQENALAPSRTT